MFARVNRLSESSRVIAVVRHGSSYNGRHCRIVALRPRELGALASQPARYAVVVSKKISKLAVTRNRLKRRFREALKTPGMPLDVWIVVFPRLTAQDASFSEIQQDVDSWRHHWLKT